MRQKTFCDPKYNILMKFGLSEKKSGHPCNIPLINLGLIKYFIKHILSTLGCYQNNTVVKFKTLLCREIVYYLVFFRLNLFRMIATKFRRYNYDQFNRSIRRCLSTNPMVIYQYVEYL